MDADDVSLDALFSHLPKVNRLGFYTASSLDLSPRFDEVIETLNELAEAREPYTDDEGYQWQITSSRVDENSRRVAWVEWRERESGRFTYDNYYLKARDEAGTLRMWEIETYNPYFGCSVEFLGWIEDAVVIIYEDKHDSYVACLERDGATRRVEISNEWEVIGKVLVYRHRAQNKRVELKLPSLNEI